MSETIVILALLAFILISQYYYVKEREKLIAAILAKDLTDLKNYDNKPKSQKGNAAPSLDAVLMDPDDTELFDKAIRKSLEKVS